MTSPGPPSPLFCCAARPAGASTRSAVSRIEAIPFIGSLLPEADGRKAPSVPSFRLQRRQYVGIKAREGDDYGSSPERNRQEIGGIRPIRRNEINPFIQRHAQSDSKNDQRKFEVARGAVKDGQGDSSGRNQQQAGKEMVDVITPDVQVGIGREI